MADTDSHEAGEAIHPVRDTTRNLVEAIRLDVWPRSGAIVDFGLKSQEHYEALYYPVRSGEITPEQLDTALGKGKELTALARSARSNPHREIEFHTDWDDLMPEWEDTAQGDAYQVWQARDPSAAGAGWSAYPGDYRHAIDVYAGSRQEAYAATSRGAWWEAMEVEVIADDVRSTAIGDVIVNPDGKAHRIGPDGFAEIDPQTEKAAREEPPVERVERQLHQWKHDHSTEFVPDPATGRIGPGTHRWLDDAWAVMSEADRLQVLEHELDWSGVTDREKEALLAREVDFTRLPPAEEQRQGGPDRETAVADSSARARFQKKDDLDQGR